MNIDDMKYILEMKEQDSLLNINIDNTKRLFIEIIFAVKQIYLFRSNKNEILEE